MSTQGPPPPDAARSAPVWSQGGRDGRRGGGRGRRGEQLMVPRAEFTSYYGRPVLKPPVWKERDIAGYLFTGGLAAGSAVLAAGADLTGRPELRRFGRLASLSALGVSTVALVHDLGRPERFYNMLRVFKPTSPMSVGSWLLAGLGGAATVAAADELPALVPPPLRGFVSALSRPAGLASAAFAPGVATYTAVLLSDTSVPSWHAVQRELPFVFAGSALAASAGLALVGVSPAQAGPARRLAVLGAGLDLLAMHRVENGHGLLGEPYDEGTAGRRLRAAKSLTVAGAAGALLGRRHRTVAAGAGLALLAGSLLTRFGVFAAGVASAKDPRYVVVPQRERVERDGPARGQ